MTTYPFELGWFQYLCLQHPGKVYLRQLPTKEMIIVVEGGDSDGAWG